MKKNPSRMVLHCGESMRPTLCDGDLLETAPVAKPLRVGDIVLFRSGGEQVVHRIVALTPEGVRTKGDNSASPDPWLLPAGCPVRLVTARIRDGRRHPVHGGPAGAVAAAWSGCRIRFAGTLLQSRPWTVLEGILGGLFRFLPLPRLRVLAFTSGKGTHRKLLLGGRVIGRYDDDRKKWMMRRRYRCLTESRMTQNSSAN